MGSSMFDLNDLAEVDVEGALLDSCQHEHYEDGCLTAQHEPLQKQFIGNDLRVLVLRVLQDLLSVKALEDGDGRQRYVSHQEEHLILQAVRVKAFLQSVTFPVSIVTQKELESHVRIDEAERNCQDRVQNPRGKNVNGRAYDELGLLHHINIGVNVDADGVQDGLETEPIVEVGHFEHAGGVIVVTCRLHG